MTAEQCGARFYPDGSTTAEHCQLGFPHEGPHQAELVPDEPLSPREAVLEVLDELTAELRDRIGHELARRDDCERRGLAFAKLWREARAELLDELLEDVRELVRREARR